MANGEPQLKLPDNEVKKLVTPWGGKDSEVFIPFIINNVIIYTFPTSKWTKFGIAYFLLVWNL